MSGHRHNAENHRSRHRLLLATLITGNFMLVEIFAGFWTGSLALLADAGHMLTDFAALFLALIALQFSLRPASENRPYGLLRAPVLAAFVNGVFLIVIAAIIIIEAVERILSPMPVLALPMLVVAVIGLLVNILVYQILHSAHDDGLNMRAAIFHVLGDILGSVAAILGALIIYFSGNSIADPILSMLVALIIIRSAIYILRESGIILLQLGPKQTSIGNMRCEILSKFPDISAIHRLRCWAVNETQSEASLSVQLTKGVDPDPLCSQLKQFMREQFSVECCFVEICTKEQAGLVHQTVENPDPVK